MSKMSPAWREALEPFLAEKLPPVAMRVSERRTAGATVFPDNDNIFRALRETPLESVKVVIVGQDPYHGPRQANGLAFAVNSGLPRPPSLRNVMIEVQNDLEIELHPASSTLLGWARQGVLLLNTCLTVEQGAPASHAEIGWAPITDKILGAVAARPGPIVFMLWGMHAKSKRPLLGYNHKILEAGHPSPLSVHRFYGCKHFTQANRYLEAKGAVAIDWTKIDAEDENA